MSSREILSSLGEMMNRMFNVVVNCNCCIEQSFIEQEYDREFEEESDDESWSSQTGTLSTSSYQ